MESHGHTAEPAELPISRVLFTETQIADRVRALAGQLSAEYRDPGGVILVGVLKGAFIFLADLARALTIPRAVEFISVSSYDLGSTAGDVRLELDLRHPISGRHVIVVEDIVDSGQTLHYLVHLLEQRAPASVKTIALLRRARHAGEPFPDYVGFDIPDEVWVVGYGLDYAEQHRTLPYIGVVEVDTSS